MADHPLPDRLRIAAHNGAPVWGGAEIAVSRLLAGLGRRGHDVRFFVARDHVARRAAEFGLETELLHVGGDVALHHAIRVCRALRRHRSQVVIVGTFRKLLHVAAGARMARVPVISRIGLEGDEPRNAKYRFLFRHWVDRVVVSSRTMKEAYLNAMPELEGRVAHVAKGVAPPTTSGSRAASRERLGIPETSVVVTSLARLVPDKRIDRFIDVIDALPPHVLGLVAGDGPLRADLERYAAERGSRVRLLGHIQRVGDLLAASDLVLVTSRRESMANAMLEAMALGVPVVSTPVDGAREVLVPDENEEPPGAVTTDFDVPSIVASVRPLVADPASRAAMGRAAARRARLRFSEDAMLDGWERVLRASIEPMSGRSS